jgi:release factor glutamine methyltransferase
VQKNTIAQCLAKATILAAVSDTPRLDLEIILAHILHKNRTYLFTWPEKVLTDIEQQQFNVCFNRRLTGEPVAHIMGVREFWSLPLSVNNSTLIPRPDTELLVEAALELFVSDGKNIQRKLLDLGTGTGAIVLALAHENPRWQCVGLDKESAAVELAEQNRLQLNLQNVSVKQSDWFSALDKQERFHIVVSNPPYIDPTDKHLQQGDVRFEPLSALIADNKGLADLEFIITHAPSYLEKDGWLLVEHGYDQGESVRTFFLQHHFIHVKTLRDIANNERVTVGQVNTI